MCNFNINLNKKLNAAIEYNLLSVEVNFSQAQKIKIRYQIRIKVVL